MSLEDLRVEIDKLDDEIIALLEKRFEIVKEVKKIKKKENIKVSDPRREEEILKKIKSIYIQEIYKSIFVNSKKSQLD